MQNILYPERDLKEGEGGMWGCGLWRHALEQTKKKFGV
jgi:hypothetical protein